MDVEERTERIIRLINFLVDSPQVPTDLKHFVLDEFTGKMVFSSIAITKRQCQFEDERSISERTDTLIAAVTPFLNAAIMKDEKVWKLTQIIEYFTPLLQNITKGREKLVEGRS